MAGSGFLKAADKTARSKGGRPPGPSGTTRRNILAAQKLFQVHAQEALDTMVAIMRNPEADFAVRLKAANDVLNRAYGTPVSTTVQVQISEEEREAIIDSSLIAAASTPELLALAEALAKYVDANPMPDVIDVTPVSTGGADDAGGD